jgi:hypothetical protein
MRIRNSFTLKWWETGLFKFSLIALGVVLGATWPEIFHAWRPVLLVVFAVPAAYLSWVWWKQ